MVAWHKVVRVGDKRANTSKTDMSFFYNFFLHRQVVGNDSFYAWKQNLWEQAGDYKNLSIWLVRYSIDRLANSVVKKTIKQPKKRTTS